jgi:nucleoside-diphosphate-sugar epimerase
VAIRALARKETNRDGFDTPIEWVEGTLRSKKALAKLVNGADAVIHLAYQHAPGRYRGGEGDNLSGWLETNVNGSLKLLLAARDAGVSRFLFLSSRAVFSRTLPGRVLDESHPISPDTHYGAYKAAVEAMVRSFGHAGGMQTCSLRATGIYGMTYPLERSKWWDLVAQVAAGKPVQSTRAGTEVHGEDVARVIWELLVRPGRADDIVHISDLIISHRDIVRQTRAVLGQPGPLPAPPPAPPANMLVCRRLQELGIGLSGWPAFEQTISRLVGEIQRLKIHT